MLFFSRTPSIFTNLLMIIYKSKKKGHGEKETSKYKYSSFLPFRNQSIVMHHCYSSDFRYRPTWAQLKLFSDIHQTKGLFLSLTSFLSSTTFSGGNKQELITSDNIPVNFTVQLAVVSNIIFTSTESI